MKRRMFITMEVDVEDLPDETRETIAIDFGVRPEDVPALIHVDDPRVLAEAIAILVTTDEGRALIANRIEENVLLTYAEVTGAYWEPR